jgi:hypothetical protein
VAAFASWHVNHHAARQALDGGLRLTATPVGNDAALVTCDGRALPICERSGVRFHVLS